MELDRRDIDRDADMLGPARRLAQASRITHSPIGTISPVSSATGMNSAGEIRPRVGWFQRSSASNEQMRFARGRTAAGSSSSNSPRSSAPQVALELAALLRALVELSSKKA